MTSSESERRTRTERIDPRLRRSGWKITPHIQGLNIATLSATALEEYPTATGPADYALCDQGRILGIAEAKKVTLSTQEVLTQADRYSTGISLVPGPQEKFGVPFHQVK